MFTISQSSAFKYHQEIIPLIMLCRRMLSLKSGSSSLASSSRTSRQDDPLNNATTLADIIKQSVQTNNSSGVFLIPEFDKWFKNSLKPAYQLLYPNQWVDIHILYMNMIYHSSILTLVGSSLLLATQQNQGAELGSKLESHPMFKKAWFSCTKITMLVHTFLTKATGVRDPKLLFLQQAMYIGCLYFIVSRHAVADYSEAVGRVVQVHVEGIRSVSQGGGLDDLLMACCSSREMARKLLSTVVVL